MQPELALRAISHPTIAISFLAILFRTFDFPKKGNKPRDAPTLYCASLLGCNWDFCVHRARNDIFLRKKIVLSYAVSQQLDTAAVSRSSGEPGSPPTA
jgi:hypothetical protein